MVRPKTESNGGPGSRPASLQDGAPVDVGGDACGYDVMTDEMLPEYWHTVEARPRDGST